jgi:hypothetical protein
MSLNSCHVVLSTPDVMSITMMGELVCVIGSPPSSSLTVVMLVKTIVGSPIITDGPRHGPQLAMVEFTCLYLHTLTHVM